jgi:hypothetical protein
VGFGNATNCMGLAANNSPVICTVRRNVDMSMSRTPPTRPRHTAAPAREKCYFPDDPSAQTAVGEPLSRLRQPRILANLTL